MISNATPNKFDADSAETIHRSCPQCHRDAAGRERSRYSRDQWTIVKCAACGFVYLENVLHYSRLVRSHAWTRSYPAERQQRIHREPYFSLFSRAYKALRVRYFWRDKGPSYIERYIQGRHVLDIGCGSGFVLKQLPARYIPYGIEIDAEAARRAERYAAGRGGYVVHCDALSGLARLSDQWIDGVLMQSFLEHENQPLPVLRHVRRVLRPGGRVIIKVPNLASWNRLVRQQRWCGFRFPDHVNYFTPDSLTRMVGTAGLDIARFGLLQRQPTSDNMWLVAERPTDPAIGRSAA